MAATKKQRRKLAKQLASAACALLGASHASAAGKFDGWDMDTAILYYSEADGRVTAIEPTIALKRSYSSGRAAVLKIVLDSLTGATPSGATPTNAPQTFTRPSGSGSYTVNAGEIPLDDSFLDTRVQVNGSWTEPLGKRSLLTLGANASKEYDFTSFGLSSILTRDYNEKNTTLTFGLSGEFDSVDPVGGVPIPFASMAAAGTTQPRQGSGDNKSVMDALFGVTQVLGPRTLTQVNYSYSRSSGYMTDPYKLLSVIDPITGATTDYVYENRPDSRAKHALYWLVRHRLSRDTVSGSYRYFTDDWGMTSHTIDLNYHWKPAEAWWLEPHVRFYRQSEVDFYHVNLLNGDPLPQEATADHRLAAFNGITLGLEYGWLLKNERQFLVRAEYYTTKGDSSPGEAIGVQRGLDLYPDLKATILQVQYKF